MIPALLVALAFPATAQDTRLPSGYRLLYATDFSAGIDAKINQQKPKPESITVVRAPGGLSGHCLQVTMERGDDFSKVANGAPRSELSFGRQFRIESGKDYNVEWSTFLPLVYPFDGQRSSSASPRFITVSALGAPRSCWCSMGRNTMSRCGVGQPIN